MPGAGTTRPGVQRRLAVGTPSARPRAKPRTTVPSSHGVAAEQARGVLDLALAHELADPGRRDALAVGRHERHGGDAEAEPLARARSASRRRRRPHARSGSSRRRRRAPPPPCATSTCSANASGESSESSCVNAITSSSSTPSCAISSARRSMPESRRGTWPGRSISDGIGSNVATVLVASELPRALERLVDQPPVPEVDAVERARARPRAGAARAPRRR